MCAVAIEIDSRLTCTTAAAAAARLGLAALAARAAATGKVLSGSIGHESVQILRNLRLVCNAA
jgi:hypothetical protein